MKRFYVALIVAAALCLTSAETFAWWKSIQQIAIGGGGGGGSGPALVSPPIIGTATYSNANRTVVMTSGAVSIQADTVLSGKIVFSATYDVAAGSDAGIGVTTIGSNTGVLGFDGNLSFGYYSSSPMWINSVNIANGASWVAGGGIPVGVAVDVTAALAWVTVDGTNYYGSTGPLTASQVSAGTSGANISAVKATGSMCAAVATQTSGNQMTLQTAYPWTIPSGFSQY